MNYHKLKRLLKEIAVIKKSTFCIIPIVGKKNNKLTFVVTAQRQR